MTKAPHRRMSAWRSRQGEALHPAIGAAALALCCLYAALLVGNWVETGHSWFYGAQGLPRPTDFVAYRLAGQLALAGDATAAYDWQTFSPAVAAFVGLDGEHWLGWLNPPSFLLFITPLAMLPYETAALAWVTGTGMLYLGVARAAWPRGSAFMLACAAPAAFACVLKGQSGFLSAALIGAGLLLLERRPVLAGLCFGLLSYKPHFGIALPILLLVGGHFRAMAAAASTVAVLAGLSAVLFGPEAWITFAGTLVGTTDRFLVQGSGLARMQSVYAAAVPTLGQPLAMMLHGCVAAAAIGAAALVWRRGGPAGPRSAAAIAATFVATPYAFDHDAPMLVLAALMLAPCRAAGRAGIIEAGLLCTSALVMAATLMMPTSLPGPLAALMLLGLSWRAAGRHQNAPARTEPGGALPAA